MGRFMIRQHQFYELLDDAPSRLCIAMVAKGLLVGQ